MYDDGIYVDVLVQIIDFVKKYLFFEVLDRFKIVFFCLNMYGMEIFEFFLVVDVVVWRKLK